MTAHAKQKLEKNQEILKPEDLLVVMAEGISHTPELCLCRVKQLLYATIREK
jgi:hypothetical protein